METWNATVNNTDMVVSPCARPTKLLKKKRERSTNCNWWHRRNEQMAEFQDLWRMQGIFWIWWSEKGFSIEKHK